MNALPGSTPYFSLIIPAYNEEAYLPILLDSVAAARARFEGGPDDIEVVVADNASTDATAEIARSSGCRVVEEDRRVIAAVRNTGARTARGQVFVFLDADNIMHPDTFNAIDRSLSSGKVIAGSSGVRMQPMSLGIAVTYALMVPLVWLTRMDTGVVFCRRDDFEAIGGYNEDLLFAEDVKLLWDLMRLGWKQGRKLTRIRSVKATYSTRKFDKHGDWHWLGLIFRFLYGIVFAKSSLDNFARKYWYGNQRSKSG
ncbi:MAG: glycosyltransferase [Desulfobacterales bacterium]|jgi:glycosyltransferase involved in cell wall biosynthesis